MAKTNAGAAVKQKAPQKTEEVRVEGIKAKNKRELKDLQDTLAENPHIEEVHFTAEGKHYFAIHEFVDPKSKKKSGKFYGYQKVTDVLAKVIGERRIYKKQNVMTPGTFILETLSAQEVMDYEFVDYGQVDQLTAQAKRKLALAAQEQDGDVNDPTLPTRKAIKKTLAGEEVEEAELV